MSASARSPHTPANRRYQQRPDVHAGNGRLVVRLIATAEGKYTHRIELAGNGSIVLDADGGDIGLNNGTQTFWLPYDHVRLTDAGKTTARLRATITRPQFEVTTIFDLRDDGSLDVTTSLAARTEMRVASVEHRYAFVPAFQEPRQGQPAWDYLWLPHLKGRRSHLAGQHSFRSPCLIIQRDATFAALLPLVDLIDQRMPLPAALDFRQPGELRYGVAAQQVEGDLFFQRREGDALLLVPGQALRFGFTVLADGDVPARQGIARSARALWERYGPRRMNALSPQTVYFDDAARYAYDGIMKRYSGWRNFRLDGKPAGGTIMRTRRSHLEAGSARPPAPGRGQGFVRGLVSNALPLPARLPYLLRTLRHHSSAIVFGARSNALRTAFGMAHYGRKWEDEELSTAAGAVCNLFCAAPLEAGLFPLAFVGSERRPAWLKGTRGQFMSTQYGTADLAETGLWLLHTFRMIEPDDRLLERCRALGEAFLDVQHEGAIPAWLAVQGGKVLPAGPFQAGATTASAGRFLAHLAAATGEDRFSAAAQRAADLVLDRVWPSQEWFDFETFFAGASKPLSWRDRESGVPPQSALALNWAADLLAEVATQTKQERYLEQGTLILDQLLLFQQIWDASFLNCDTFGGFGISNTSGAWSDVRGALFVPTLLRYYELTGRREYLERAIAALRASFVLMHAPENGRVASGNAIGETENDYGAVSENYGCAGDDRRAGPYVYPNWGAGSAAAIAALVQHRYGDLYLDAARNHTYGFNGCRVLDARVSVRVVDLQIERLPVLVEPLHRTPLAREKSQSLLVKCLNLPAAEMSLWINNHDLGKYTSYELAQGVNYPPAQTVNEWDAPEARPSSYLDGQDYFDISLSIT